MTRGIRVKNTDDIQKINKIVTRYGFDIWIHGKSGMVDDMRRQDDTAEIHGKS